MSDYGERLGGPNSQIYGIMAVNQLKEGSFMLETIIARQVVFYVAGAVAAIGIIAKLVAGISLKRLVGASSNMSKSNHALMRLVRAKFEHACMVSDKVQNVRAFVEKYVYEYRIIGLRLHSWRRLERTAIWLYALVCAFGAGAEYYVGGPGDAVYQYAIVGAAGVVVLFLIHIMTDEKYQLEAAKVYMVDFLENTYAHRYVKTNQKEIQVTVQKAEDISEDGQAVAAQPEKIPVEEPGFRPQVPVEEPGTGPQVTPDNPVQPQPVIQPGDIPQPGGMPQIQSGVQAAASPYIQASGQPKNASAFGGGTVRQHHSMQSHAAKGASMKGDIVQEHPAQGQFAQKQPAQNQSMSGYMGDEPREQDMPKEAKIREILEEFLA